MDKHEFNIKVEQMKKMVGKSDFQTAAKIADTINWRRVKSTNLLTTVSNIYEEIQEYQEAIEILLIAFERNPGGKYLLYKLTILALKNKNIPEAEAYYDEFCEIASEDVRRHLLRYLILKAKGASLESLMNALGCYVSEELDEEWLYELAELYHQAGNADECVQLCDKIILLFGIGIYVDKAMELKLRHQPLNQYQQDLMENRGKYEEKLKAVEREYNETPPASEMARIQEPEEKLSFDQELNAILKSDPAGELLESASKDFKDHPDYPDYEERVLEETIMESEDILSPSEEFSESEDITDQLSDKIEPESEFTGEPELNEESQGLDSEPPIFTKAEEGIREKQGNQSEQTTVQEKQIKAVTPMAAAALKQAVISPEKRFKNSFHTIVEAEDAEIGLKYAIQILKNIHKKQGIKKPVVKITGERINKKGMAGSKDHLLGKDLIIEQAGDMTTASIGDLYQWMLDKTNESTILLVDNPRQVYRILIDHSKIKQSFKHEKAALDMLFTGVPKEHLGVSIHEKAGSVASKNSKKELSQDAFENYANEYAQEIDCTIPEKSLTALRERIELMKVQGVALTRENAEDLIETAADQAEKPTKSIAGVFSPKYSKEGLLILKENHFLE